MSLTNVTFPKEEQKALRSAADYYGFETLSQFFRSCAFLLIEHHEKKDTLEFPLKFQAVEKRSK
jgi:hypothetical protein